MTFNIYTDGTIDIINKKGLRENTPFDTFSDLPDLCIIFGIGNIDEHNNFTINESKLKFKDFKFNICNRKNINNTINIEYNELERLINELIKLKNS
jgi:hypothetical protein